MNEMLEGYVEDLKYNLINLDEALIELQKGNVCKDTINTIFRVAHTIKGNSAAMEFYNIEKVTHAVEDILQEVRSGKRMLTDIITNVLYSFHDFMEDCLTVINQECSDKNIIISEIEKKINIVSNEGEEYKCAQTELQEFNISKELWDVILDNFKRGFIPYIFEVAIDEECVMKSLRTWLIFEVVSRYGSIVSSIPECPEDESLGKEEFVLKDNKVRFIVVTDREIEELTNGVNAVSEVIDVKRKEINVSLYEPQIETIKQNNEEVIVKTGTNTAGNLQSQMQSAVKEKLEGNFIRIPVMKVDSLMDMLGELLILNSQFEQQIDELVGRNSAISNNLSRASKLIKEIQATSMALRMIEIKPTLHRLHRIARDTAGELNKKISVVIEGEETEIDRSAAEKIFDPLMHLVRNAVSHGIEDEQERVSADKETEGTVRISAYSKRGNVYIEVSDDGRGIDTKKIVKKAIALNMAEENKEYSEEDIIKFIFKPGFSTQEVVNNISGRGVGMNVVEETITRMGGKIDITNIIGEGCTFTIKIPMNLAVINGTIVEVAGGRYIIPTLFIKEFFIADKSNWVNMQGKARGIRMRNNIIPVIDACRMFGIPAEDAVLNRREIVILEMDQKLLAFPVNKILARQEIVSKPLESEFSSIDYASGAAILGDGKVSLILDVEAMFKMN